MGKQTVFQQIECNSVPICVHFWLWHFIFTTKNYAFNWCFGRFVPRHEDELELEVDDPLLVEVQAEDFWYEGYNMRTGARGIFPAYYAMEVNKDSENHSGTLQRRQLGMARIQGGKE